MNEIRKFPHRINHRRSGLIGDNTKDQQRINVGNFEEIDPLTGPRALDYTGNFMGPVLDQRSGDESLSQHLCNTPQGADR